jgi:methionyl-tRNA formyltransferase
MEAIYSTGGNLDLVITLKDDKSVKKSGRVYVDQFCKLHNINLYKCNHINDLDTIDMIKLKQIDWLFIIGWSQIASNDVLSSTKKGVIGAHPTLLPKGRGRASIPWAIIKKLNKTGVTLFKLDKGIDTGDIIDQVEIPMHNNINATELYETVNKAHIDLINKVIPKLLSNSINFTIQKNQNATYWPGRKPEDGEIDLSGSVHDAELLIRAVTHPYPGAFIFYKSKKLVIWKANIKNTPNQNCLKFKDGFLELIDFEFKDYC